MKLWRNILPILVLQFPGQVANYDLPSCFLEFVVPNDNGNFTPKVASYDLIIIRSILLSYDLPRSRKMDSSVEIRTWVDHNSTQSGVMLNYDLPNSLRQKLTR